jgi:hypothetical protein
MVKVVEVIRGRRVLLCRKGSRRRLDVWISLGPSWMLSNRQSSLCAEGVAEVQKGTRWYSGMEAVVMVVNTCNDCECCCLKTTSSGCVRYADE